MTLRPAARKSAMPVCSAGSIISTTPPQDRKSTRLNSSHLVISYAVFCLKKKNNSVLADAEGEDVDAWLLGGDYCAFGPWPVGTLERLRPIYNANWQRAERVIRVSSAPL